MYTGSLGVKTNRETWTQTIAVVDQDGVDVNIAAATIEIAVRLKGNTTADLSATVGDGITISSPDFTFTFSETDMETLDPGIYDVGIVVTISSTSTQLLVGTVSIVDGILD